MPKPSRRDFAEIKLLGNTEKLLKEAKEKKGLEELLVTRVVNKHSTDCFRIDTPDGRSINVVIRANNALKQAMSQACKTSARNGSWPLILVSLPEFGEELGEILAILTDAEALKFQAAGVKTTSIVKPDDLFDREPAEEIDVDDI